VKSIHFFLVFFVDVLLLFAGFFDIDLFFLFFISVMMPTFGYRYDCLILLFK